MQYSNKPSNDSLSDQGDRQSSATKMLQILLGLGELGLKTGGVVRLVDLVERTQYPRPTVHRLLNVLKQAGFVAQDALGPYHLGPKILLLAAQSLGGLDVRRIAHPILQVFSEQICHTVHLGIRDGLEITYIDKVEAPDGVHVGSTIGQRRAIPVSALGKALLAHSPPALLDQVRTAGWTCRTPNTLSTIEELQQQLIEIRRSGYALDNEECDLGLRCVAAAVFNHANLPIAAISVTTLKSQVDDAELKHLGIEIATIAHHISQMLGTSGENATG